MMHIYLIYIYKNKLVLTNGGVHSSSYQKSLSFCKLKQFKKVKKNKNQRSLNNCANITNTHKESVNQLGSTRKANYCVYVVILPMFIYIHICSADKTSNSILINLPRNSPIFVFLFISSWNVLTLARAVSFT